MGQRIPEKEIANFQLCAQLRVCSQAGGIPVSTGENLPFLEEEYEVATENGGFQMNGRWSDNPIVL